jgi:hypothetical protein
MEPTYEEDDEWVELSEGLSFNVIRINPNEPTIEIEIENDEYEEIKSFEKGTNDTAIAANNEEFFDVSENSSHYDLINNQGSNEQQLEIESLKKQLELVSIGINKLHSILTAPALQQTIATSVLEQNPQQLFPLTHEQLPSLLANKLQELVYSAEKLSLAYTSKQQYPKITFMHFAVGDITLFMPAFVDNRKLWMAFNSGAPHYFLAEVI